MSFLMVFSIICSPMTEALASDKSTSEVSSEVSGKANESSAQMPAQSFKEVTENGVTVTVEADAGAFPASTTMEVLDLSGDSALQMAQTAADEDAKVAGATGVDISFFDASGNQIEPADQQKVHVSISLDGGLEGENPSLLHESDDGVVEEVANVDSIDNSSAEFDASEFSPYVIYTVDFNYNGYQYSLAGEGEVLLSDLFQSLGIDASVSSVKSVTFSDSSLIDVEKQNDGDWLLTSLKSFDTNETLTITMGDGTTYEVAVTDPSSSTVDHIDLLIEATATASIPVVGTDGTVTTDNLEQKVELTKNDLLNATITSTVNFTKGSNIQTSTDSSGKAQLRIPGTFPVGTATNPVKYTVTVIKDVTFTDSKTGNTYTIPVTLTSTFSYWDATNDCPGIGKNGRNSDGTPKAVYSNAGMDFSLSSADNNVRAVEVEKVRC